jgi:sugar lactone lactonase YvrE
MKKIITSLLFIAFYYSVLAYPGKIIKSFEAPGQYITGITFDGKNLWVSDRKADKIYCINPDNGKVVNSISSPAYWPVGLAFDGQYLWNADSKGGIPMSENYAGMIYKIDPADGTIVHQLVSPSPVPKDLTWDGKYLWLVDDRYDILVQFDSKDGTTIKEFMSPASNPSGLTFDGTYLWVSDCVTNEIYMVNPENGTVLMTIDAPDKNSCGLAFDGKNLWNTDRNNSKIYCLVHNDEELYITKNPKKSVIRYTHLTSNFGPGTVKSLDVYFAIPENRINQKLLKETQYSIKPEFIKDKWGQDIAHFQTKNLKSGEQCEIIETIYAETYEVRYFIFPDKVGSLNEIPQDIKDKYLVNDTKYEFDHPVIQSALKESVGNEKNPYWIARKIYDYLILKMYYEMTGGWNTAPTVLARGNGSCSEYSFVYISMCRAAGLPARYVGSIVQRGQLVAMDDVFHRWVEVYLPNYGWIPVDPSGGDQTSPAAQARYFGYLGNRFLITTQSGGGSEYLDWQYNSNVYHTCSPKTFVVHEYFGDWVE